MEALRLDTLSAQVVAWHNRHPLARRIAAAQVHAMGYVVLPGMQVQLRQAAMAEARATMLPSANLAAGADAAAEAAVSSPALMVQLQGAAAAVSASEAAAYPTSGAAPAVEPAAAPSLRERLASRPAQALPEAAASAQSVLAPPAAPPASSAAAPVPQTATAALRLAFTERFFEHASAHRVAAWALQQARVLVVKLPMGAAVRRLQREPSLSVAEPGVDEIPVDLLLRTATLQAGTRRLRLLIGPGDDPAVLGSRLWSLPRVALACLPVLLLPLTAGTAWWLGAQSVRTGPALAMAQPPAALAASAVAVAAGVAGSTLAAQGLAGADVAPAAGPNPAQPAQDAAVAFAASAASAVAAAVVVSAPPEDTEPRLGRVELPPLGPLFADPRFEPTLQRRLAARAAGAAASPMAASSPAVAAPAPTAAAAFALTTRLLRTAAESEQVQAAMRTLLALMLEGSARVQRVPVGDDWRVMGGPFVSRAAADKARAQLLARGVRTEVVEIPAAAAVAAVTSAGR